MELLSTVASIITPELLNDPAKARSFLKSRVELQSLFTAGLLLISKEGKGVADYPLATGRVEGLFKEVEIFR